MLDDDVAVVDGYYSISTNLLPKNTIKKVDIVQNNVYSLSDTTEAEGSVTPSDWSQTDDSANSTLLTGMGFASVEFQDKVEDEINYYPQPNSSYGNITMRKDSTSFSLGNLNTGEYTKTDMLKVGDATYFLAGNKTYPYFDFRTIQDDVVTKIDVSSVAGNINSKVWAVALSNVDSKIYIALATESSPYLVLLCYENGTFGVVTQTWSSGLIRRITDIKMKGTQGIACLASTSSSKNFLVFSVTGNSYEYKDSNISGYYPMCVGFLPYDNSYGVMGGCSTLDQYAGSATYQTDEPYRFYYNGSYHNIFSSTYDDGTYTAFDTASYTISGTTYHALVVIYGSAIRVFCLDGSSTADYCYSLTLTNLEDDDIDFDITSGFEKLKILDYSISTENYTDMKYRAYFSVLVSGRSYHSTFAQYYKDSNAFKFSIGFSTEPFGSIFYTACSQWDLWRAYNQNFHNISSTEDYCVYTNANCSVSGGDFVSTNMSRLQIDEEQTATLTYTMTNKFADPTAENFKVVFKNFLWWSNISYITVGQVSVSNPIGGFEEVDGVNFNQNYIDVSVLISESEVKLTFPKMLIYSTGQVLYAGCNADGFYTKDYFSGLKSFEFSVVYGGLTYEEVQVVLGDENNSVQVYQISGNGFYETASLYGAENLAEHNGNIVLDKWSKGKQYLEIEIPVKDYYNESGDLLVGENTAKQEFAPYDKFILQTRKGYSFVYADGSPKVFEIKQMTFRKKGYKSMILKCLEV